MKRKKLFIFLVVCGLVLYLLITAKDFMSISLYYEKHDFIKQHGRFPNLFPSSSLLIDDVEKYSCFNVYATLFVQHTQEDIAFEKLLFELSSATALPVGNFIVDDMVMTSGLPGCYCKYFYQKTCSVSAKLPICSGRLSLDLFPKNINVLASFNDSSQCSQAHYCQYNKSITWQIMKRKHCDELSYETILHIISSYHELVTLKKLKSFHCYSFLVYIFSVTMEPVSLAELENELPFKLKAHRQKSEYIKAFSHIRLKRSAVRATPAVSLPPSAIAVPSRPAVHYKPTPIFDRIPNSSNLYNQSQQWNFERNGTFHSNFGVDMFEKVPNLSFSSHSFLDQTNIQETGSSSENGESGSGSGLTPSFNVDRSTNSYHNQSYNSVSDEVSLRTSILQRFIMSSVKSLATVSTINDHTLSAPTTGNLLVDDLTVTYNLSSHLPSLNTTQFPTADVFPNSESLTTLSSQSDNRTIFHPLTQASSSLTSVDSSTMFIEKVTMKIHLTDTQNTYVVPVTGPEVHHLSAKVGKVFLFDIPESWKEFLKFNSSMNLSNSASWLWYDANLMKVVGFPLLSDKQPNEILISLNAPTPAVRPQKVQLTIKVRSNTAIVNPPYIVETNFSLNDKNLFLPFKNVTFSFSYISAIFVLKLFHFLPHVQSDDVTISNFYHSVERTTIVPDMVEKSIISVQWFIEKFTARTFTQYYEPLIVDNDGEASTKTFFFKLLPELVLQSTRILKPREKKINVLNPEFNDPSESDQIQLSIALPIIVALCVTLLVIALVLLRYRRRSRRFGKNILIDRTYAKRRKPVCLREEIEMYNFQPTKPKILSEDLIGGSERSDRWKETILGASYNMPSSSSESGLPPSEQQNSWEGFEAQNSGSYSFVNSCFVQNDDCDSLVSAQDDESGRAKAKGD